MRPLLLLDLVGLTARQVGEETPNLRALAQRGTLAPMQGVLPASPAAPRRRCSPAPCRASMAPWATGWLQRATQEVGLWRQANTLVEGEKLYETARRRDPSFTCAKVFWWWNMGAAVDWSITPRPFYPADGRKIVATYSWPTAYGAELERELGPFPFFDFWGPKAGLPSSRWIADAAIRTLETQRPTLTMAYLPHLDYDHQRYGPRDPRSVQALRELDAIVGDLVAAADRAGAGVVAVSEYGIAEVDTPVHINRALREAGLLVARATPVGETLDPFGSRAFALADHQVAHVYCKDQASEAAAARVLEALPGVEHVLDRKTQGAYGIDHSNAGELVAISEARAWFTYYYWLDDAAEPDFARSVDIHNKPGYDPCEMLVDPALKVPMLRVARRLAQKKLGMRYLMDVIPVDAKLIRGSHGTPRRRPARRPGLDQLHACGGRGRDDRRQGTRPRRTGPFGRYLIPMAAHEIFAYLCVRDAAAAIRFYVEAFGAAESFSPRRAERPHRHAEGRDRRTHADAVGPLPRERRALPGVGRGRARPHSLARRRLRRLGRACRGRGRHARHAPDRPVLRRALRADSGPLRLRVAARATRSRRSPTRRCSGASPRCSSSAGSWITRCEPR